MGVSRGMAEAKTRPTDVSVDDFIDAVEPIAKREDAKVLDALFRKVTGETPHMWGPTIIGYGTYHYKYESGREGDAARSGFSPRKAKVGCGYRKQLKKRQHCEHDQHVSNGTAFGRAHS